MTVTPERILTRLKGHVLQHGKDWSKPLSPRLVWMWDDNPGECPRLSDDPGKDIMSMDPTNPLGLLYGFADNLISNEKLRDTVASRLPATWYGVGVFYQARTIATSDPPERCDIRELVIADREGRSYQAFTFQGGVMDGQTDAQWWVSGEGNLAFRSHLAVERIAASYIGFLAKRQESR